LSDERHFTIDTLQADGWWRLGAHTLLQAGAEWKSENGRYDYSDQAEFALLFLTPGASLEPPRAARSACGRRGNRRRLRQLAVRPGRWRLRQTWACAGTMETLAEQDSSQWSPRTVLMWRPTASTRLRVGWVVTTRRKGINELQVSDGETEVPTRATRDTPHREPGAGPHTVADAARGALPEGLRPPVCALMKTC
jgi:hypothetical protein